MKKIVVLKIAAILLILAGVISCKKENNETVKQIEFTKYALNESCCEWENLNYDGKVIIINSMQDLENYVNCTDGDLTEVDFSKNTLLLASGVNAGEVANVTATLLTKTADKDEYVLDVIIYENETDAVSANWQIAVLTPKISDVATVSINKSEATEIEYQEYSLMETSCVWEYLDCFNKVIIINSNAKLANYITCTEGTLPEIDFSKNTLLVACGGTTNNVDEIIPSFHQNSDNKYTLNVKVRLGIAMVAQGWSTKIIVPKLSDNAKIELNVNIKKL